MVRDALPNGKSGVYLTIVDGGCRLTSELLVEIEERPHTSAFDRDEEDAAFRHLPGKILERGCSSTTALAPPAPPTPEPTVPPEAPAEPATAP